VLTCARRPDGGGFVCARQRAARASLETDNVRRLQRAVAVADAGQPDGYTYNLACREGTVFDASRLHWHQP
jgi:hypothetical protein